MKKLFIALASIALTATPALSSDTINESYQRSYGICQKRKAANINVSDLATEFCKDNYKTARYYLDAVKYADTDLQKLQLEYDYMRYTRLLYDAIHAENQYLMEIYDIK